MVQGFWRPRGNRELILLCQQLLGAVRFRRKVFFVHVKGHTGDTGNERADANADLGTKGQRKYFAHDFGTDLELALHWSKQTFSAKPPSTRIVGKRRGAGQAPGADAGSADKPWFMQRTWPTIPPPALSWTSLADALVSAADAVVGRSPPNGLTDMNTPEDKAKLQSFRRGKEQIFAELRAAMGNTAEGELRKRMHSAQRAHACFKARARWRGINRVVRQLENAHRYRDSSQFYSLLRKLGVHLDGRTREGQEQFSLESLREHVLKVGGTVKDVSDEVIHRWGPQQAVEHSLADIPTDIEIYHAMSSMRDSAGGTDEVTLGLLHAGGVQVKAHLVELIRFMWRAHPSQWDGIVKSGIMLPHHKKGDRSDLHNYRFICLLCLLSRILARIVASRVSDFAERKDLLPQHQWGFRSHRSAMDPIFIMRVLADLANTVAWRKDPDLVPIIVVLWDLRKAYPSTQRFPAYKLYARMGFPDKLLQILYGLHDLTSYEIRTREGYSLPFSLPVGLREGCPSSPVLFNLVYSAVVQSYLQLRASRGSLGIRLGSLEGTPIHARRGTGAPGARLAKKLGKPIEFMDLQDLLFADDSNCLGRADEHEQAESDFLACLEEWASSVNPKKTERIQFRPGSSAAQPKLFASAARFVGAWIQEDGLHDVDTDKRLSAANNVWKRLYRQLPRLGLTPPQMGIVIRATVEASLYWGCESRAFTAPQLRRYQVFMNKVVRGIARQQLRTMHAQQVTMADLHKRYRILPCWIAIGHRQLQYVGHLARLPPERAERRMLWAWLDNDVNHPGRKSGQTTRQQLWQRIRQLMTHSKEPEPSWVTSWYTVAAAAEGNQWRSLYLRSGSWTGYARRPRMSGLSSMVSRQTLICPMRRRTWNRSR